MRAFNCKCECGESGDRLFKSNEVVHCHKCGAKMEKVGGPIGGSDIFSIAIGQPDRFGSFVSTTLGRVIATPEEMAKAYDEMYAVKFNGAAKIAKESPPPAIIDDEEDEDEDKDEVEEKSDGEDKLPDEVAALPHKSGEYKKIRRTLYPPKKRGRPKKAQVPTDDNV